MKHKIILILVVLLFSSCRVAKKNWVKENFTEKATVKKSLTLQSNALINRIENLQETLTAKYDELSKESSKETRTEENESTTVTGNITAEEGKEKSVTIGATTIKSDGANVSFQTNFSKSVSKEFLEKMSALSNEINTQSNKIIELNKLVEAQSRRLSELESNKEIKKNTSSKDVTKRGFSFGAWLIGLLIFSGLILFFFLKSKIKKIPGI